MAATVGLQARARRFAALGEPARLAIVEHLTLGDAAPSELGALVQLPSNHLAFHLKVLQEAGIVRRVRSEGDRRRSYVQLRLDDPTVATLVAMTDPAAWLAHLAQLADGRCRVVFVCTHNSARSQLAAAEWERVSGHPTTSAGTHPARRVHPRAVTAARRHGLTLARRGTRPLDQTLRPGDLLVAVCDNAYEELTPAGTDRTARPSDRVSVDLHWAVPDPARVDTDHAFDAVYDDLARRVHHLADTLERTTDRA
jgi:protein-tyrosine-phosphatase